jgi:lipopolysaccharide/colanic/teichoic acid biosynthesis glycosyltransferase
MYKGGGKQIIDFIASLTLIVVLAPFLLILTILLAIANQGSPLFIQARPGLHERSFKLLKFKTMSDARDKAGNLLPDKDRITKVGALVRKTSLDELPQIFNVLSGSMSLIGPRPLLFKYLPLYNATQRRRHEVRPGITGWAQVNGRNSIAWTQKFALDIYYIDNLSFGLDLKILWLTVKKVILREGVNQNDERPMQPFTGENS